LLRKIVCTVSGRGGGGAGRASQGCDAAGVACAPACGAKNTKARVKSAARATRPGTYLPMKYPFSRIIPLSRCLLEQHGASFNCIEVIPCQLDAERENPLRKNPRRAASPNAQSGGSISPDPLESPARPPGCPLCCARRGAKSSCLSPEWRLPLS